MNFPIITLSLVSYTYQKHFPSYYPAPRSDGPRFDIETVSGRRTGTHSVL